METLGITVGLCGLATLFVWYCIACCLGSANSDYRRYYYTRKGYRFFLEKGWPYEHFVEKYTDRRDRFWWFLSIDSKERKCYERDQFNKMLIEAPELVAKFFSKEQQKFRFRKEFHQMRDEWMKIELSFNECEKAPQLPLQGTSNNNKTQQLTFSELITISDVSTKDQVLANIGTYLSANYEGKNLALLIATLCQLGYLSTTTEIAPLLKVIAGYYGVTLGSPQGVTNYINRDKSHKFKSIEVDNTATLINKRTTTL